MAQRAYTTDKPGLWLMHARHQAAAFCTLAVPHGALPRARCHHLLNYYLQCVVMLAGDEPVSIGIVMVLCHIVFPLQRSRGGVCRICNTDL